MDLMGVDTAVTIGCGLVIIVGIFGTVIPHVPGLFLCWAAVVGWAFLNSDGSQRWITAGIVTALAVVGSLLKYIAPGRRLRREGVPTRSLLAGSLLGVIGFFVIPVLGLFLGFVAGIFFAELARLGSGGLAWPSTWRAVKAVGMSMIIEIFFGLCILGVWLWAVFLS